MYKYFVPPPTSKEEAKKQYHALALQHHPDRPGGDTETMKQINAEYSEILLSFSRSEQTERTRKAHAEGKKSASDYHDMEGVYKDLAEKIRAALDLAGATVELCGLWVWVTFEAKPDETARATLKANGFRWSPNKSAWYFAGIPSMGRGKHTLDDIRGMYGSRQFSREEKEEIKQKGIPQNVTA